MYVRVGTSGYSYKPWKGPFYPSDLPDNQMLRYYSERFPAVEINNTFYRMPSSQLLRGWSEQVPPDFVFVLKASRRITHLGRLKPETVGDSLDYLLQQADSLGDKLGPVLFQLPPNFRMDLDRLRGFLDLLPTRPRAALEFRHVSWFDEPVYALLRERNVALCYSDGEVAGGAPFRATADWGYLRLRGIEYTDEQLADWARTIREQAWTDVFLFFKHEDEATGPELAERFRKIFGRQ